jgi:inorganic pyrophosphatase
MARSRHPGMSLSVSIPLSLFSTLVSLGYNHHGASDPIFHDTRKGAPRFVENVWPHVSYPFLYGSVPQTWESPNFEHPFTGFEGDNDPIDLFDIGQE